MTSNPHTCEPKDAPMTAAEYAEWAQGYEMWLSMCAAQTEAVMQDGLNSIGEPREFDW